MVLESLDKAGGPGRYVPRCLFPTSLYHCLQGLSPGGSAVLQTLE